MKSELPLFEWSPPECEIIAFPLARRVGKARHVAQVLAGMSGRRRDAYWRQIVEQFIRELERTSMAPEQAERQVAAFQDAVCRALGLCRTCP